MVKLIWPVLLVWKHASAITQYGMYDFPIYYWTYRKKYTKPIVLIIDEWLLLKLTEAEARNLFELIHKRRKKSSTIFCSQFRESEWYQQICDGESTLADAIMDRISYDSYKIDIESVDPSKDLSMREVYGLDPAMAK